MLEEGEGGGKKVDDMWDRGAENLHSREKQINEKAE